MSTIDGLHVTGEANFSDHGANRLGASALMQGLADGYFIIPNTIGDYLASQKLAKVDTDHDAFREATSAVAERTKKFLSINGKRTVASFHRELGKIMWDYCGMSRNDAGLRLALKKIPGAAGRVLARRQRARQRRRAESGAGKGGSCGRLLRARRADVPRRAPPHRIVRGTFPGGKSDSGRVKPFATTQTSPTWPRGNTRASARARFSTKSLSFSRTSSCRSGATSNESHASRLAAGRCRRTGQDGPIRGARHQSRHVVPRDARCRQRAAHGAQRDPDRL